MSLLLERAKRLKEKNSIEGLKDLQRTIWRSFQATAMLQPYLSPDHEEKVTIEFNFCGQHKIYDCFQGEVEQYIALSESVITYPWHPTRILSNLGTIGKGLIEGTFSPSLNHSANYFWPLMLTQVTGGNHSIAQGIIRGEGEIMLHDWYDLTPLIEMIRCNGEHWIDIKTNKKIAPVKYIELGFSWEVGRILSTICSPPPYTIESSKETLLTR